MISSHLSPLLALLLGLGACASKAPAPSVSASERGGDLGLVDAPGSIEHEAFEPATLEALERSLPPVSTGQECLALERGKRWQSAKQCYTKVLQDPSVPDEEEPALLIKLAASAERAGDWELTIRALYLFLHRYPEAPFAPTALVVLAKMYEAHGYPNQASKIFLTYLNTFSDHAHVCEVRLLCASVEPCASELAALAEPRRVK